MIALISDVHGNYAALRAVLAAIDALPEPVSEILSLGDVAGYYCQINECIDALRARGVRNLLGNHDHYLLSGIAPGRSSSASLCIDYQRQIIRPDSLSWLGESRPGPVRRGPLSLTHAGWDDPIEEYVTEVRADYFAARDGDVFVSGHTHVQGAWPAGAKLYCNPGSVGQPRDGDPRAAFAVWTGAEMQFHRVAYDIEEVTSAMAAAGFAERFYENLRMGARIGGQFSQVRAIP